MDIFVWLIIPLGIFFARVCDVSMGTVRISFISRGIKMAAPIAFFQALIWLFAIREVMTGEVRWESYLAFAGGFATGTYVGMHIEKRLSIGTVIIRLVTRTDASELLASLKEKRYGVTSMKGDDMGPVDIIFSVMPRHDVSGFTDLVNKYNPDAFYSIEDIKAVGEATFPERHHSSHARLNQIRPWRLGK